MGIEKEFDSLDQNFLIFILEKYGFGKNVILWVKILLRDPESCVINVGTTTKSFSLGRGVRQGEPISAFLFILALEVLSILKKSKTEIEGMTIFNYNHLYSAYADDTSFFLKDIISGKHMVNTFYFFSYLSGLKTSLTKSENAFIGFLKGVQMAVCGMCCINLNTDPLKVLGTKFSYNKNLKEETKVNNIITDIQ